MNVHSPYLSFWQLDAPVFLRSITSDQVYLNSHLRAFTDRIQLFCGQGTGLVLLSGPRGSGRSTILRWLYEGTNTDLAEPLLMTLVKEETQPGWLLARLQQILNVTVKRKGGNFEDAFRTIAERCERFLKPKRGLVIMVDGVENIRTVAALGEIAAFLNLPSMGHFRVVVILTGTDQSAELCRKAAGLGSKILSHLHVLPLTADEIGEYLAHRCRIGGMGQSPFGPSAQSALHSMTGGILNRVNALAENCLIEAASRRQRIIDQGIVVAAGKFLDLGLPTAADTKVPPLPTGQAALQSPPPAPGAMKSEPLAALFRLDPSLARGKKKDGGSES